MNAHSDQQDSQRVKSMIRVICRIILKKEGKLTSSCCKVAMAGRINLEQSHEHVSTARCVK